MRLRFLASALALALFSGTAYSQVGLYFNPIVTRVSNSTPDTGPFAYLGQNQTSQIFGGVDFGGYYEFAHYTKFDIGADIRDQIEHGNSASLNSFLAGARIVAKPGTYGIKPYLQASLGEGRTRSPYNPVHIVKFQYNFYAGVDKVLNKHVDWRVVEIGYGSVLTINSTTVGTAAPVGVSSNGTLLPGPPPFPSAKLLSFSTGFVFRVGGK